MFESINALFNNVALRKFLVRYRIVLGIALVVLLFWQLGWRAENFWLAFAVSMVGEFIQLWCFASLDKNSTLAFRGPYSLVRNPMYLGRYFIILGMLLLLDSGRLVVIIVYTVLYWFYMTNRVKREEALLKEVFGQSYADYCAEVRPFLPRLTPCSNGTLAFWDSRLFRNCHGSRNLIATLVVWGLIALLLFS
jgi:protein-S-isoprenylcysteine O-methyltransferase Ste14